MNKQTVTTNHDFTSIRFTKVKLIRLRSYGKCGDTIEQIIEYLMNDHDKNHQSKHRNYKGQFIKKE
jgi:hypothetical protein